MVTDEVVDSGVAVEMDVGGVDVAETVTPCGPTEFVGEGGAGVDVVAAGDVVGETVGVIAAATVIVCVALAAK